MYDDSNFVSVSRVVRDIVRDSQRLNVVVIIFVLQIFVVQGGTIGSIVDQEVTRLLVVSRLVQIVNTLEVEYRVIDVERDYRQIVGVVRGRRCQLGIICVQFVDFFLQNLIFFVFFIVSNLFAVLRGVLLIVRVVNINLTEQIFYIESTRFVGDDRYQTIFDRFVFQYYVQSTNESDSGRDFFVLFF